MMNYEKVIDYINDRWPETVSGRLAKAIVREIAPLRSQEAQCLSYGDLLSMAGLCELSSDFHSAITILTAGKCPVLRAYGVFVDADGDEFPVTGEDFSALMSNNFLVHPSTGEVIEDASAYVAPVFEKIITDCE